MKKIILVSCIISSMLQGMDHQPNPNKRTATGPTMPSNKRPRIEVRPTLPSWQTTGQAQQCGACPQPTSAS